MDGSHINFPSITASQNSDITSDPTLEFISRILLEEEIDELNITGFKEVPALNDMEKTFYDILGEKYPPSPRKPLDVSQPQSDCKPIISEAQASLSSTSEGFVQDSSVEKILATEFERGVEEGKKFLPTINKQAIDLQLQPSTHSTGPTKHKDDYSVGFSEQEKGVGLMPRSKSKKNSIDPGLGPLEGRKSKISMVYSEEPIRDDIYDKVLLDHEGDYAKEQISNLQESIQNEANSSSYTRTQEDHTELQLLLHHCSEAVAVDDRQRAKKLLERIRKQSARNGNGIQRLACVLADGLEARLAGIGREYYRGIMAKRVIAPDSYFLKAYHLYLTAAPFFRVYFCFANNNILKEAENASKLHIVDLGINYGFQWPPLIQSLAKRKGGPPHLRITGIDFPQSGFRPAKRVEEIGKRLENYARNFKVPFEFQAVVSKWESISINDLNIRDDEVLIVNTLLRFKKVGDETFDMDSPRNRVLSLVRQMKPRIFIQAIFNVLFSPYFVTRFKQVLSFYSVIFDLLDLTIPRDNTQRQLPERVFFIPDIINIVACEGVDWIEKPETYKQWHLRTLRAGFEPLPVDPHILKECINKRNGYDKRFFIQEESNWLLQGWKGRVITGLSTWRPKLEQDDNE